MSWGCVRLCLCCNFGQVSSQVLVALLLNSLLHQLRVPIMSKNKKRKRITRLAFFVLQPWRPGFFNTWQFWNTVLAYMQILLNSGGEKISFQRPSTNSSRFFWTSWNSSVAMKSELFWPLQQFCVEETLKTWRIAFWYLIRSAARFYHPKCWIPFSNTLPNIAKISRIIVAEIAARHVHFFYSTA